MTNTTNCETITSLLELKHIVLQGNLCESYNSFLCDLFFMNEKDILGIINDYVMGLDKWDFKTANAFFRTVDNIINKKIMNDLDKDDNVTLIYSFILKFPQKGPLLFKSVDYIIEHNNIDLSATDILKLIGICEPINSLLISMFKNKHKVNTDRLEDYYNSYFGSLVLDSYFDLNDITTFSLSDSKKNASVYTREEEQDMFRRLANGEDVLEDIVLHNQGLVKSEAYKYNRNPDDFDDNVQEGNIGLLSAIENFDYTRGIKFSTYAVWRIKRAIQLQGIDTSSVIRLPKNEALLYKKIKAYIADYEGIYGINPSIHEIAEEFRITEKKASDLLVSGLAPLSLDKKLGEEEDTCLMNIISADDGKNLPLEGVINEDLKFQINKALDNFSERERDIIESSFGLNGKEKETGSKIAERYGVTGERIRQVKIHVLEELRKNKTSASALRPYFDNQEITFKKYIIKDICKSLNVKDCNIFNAFLSYVPDYTFNIMRKDFDSHYKFKYGLSKSEYDNLTAKINDFRHEMINVSDDLSLRIIYDLITYSGHFNIFSYLDSNDKYIIEKAIFELSFFEKRFLNLFVDFNTGKLIKKLDFKSSETMIAVINRINSKLSFIDVTNVYNSEDYIYFCDWINCYDIDKVNYMLSHIYFGVVDDLKTLFGEHFNKKTLKENLNDIKYKEHLHTIKYIMKDYVNPIPTQNNTNTVLLNGNTNLYRMFGAYTKRDVMEYLYSMYQSDFMYIADCFDLKTGEMYQRLSRKDFNKCLDLFKGINAFYAIPNVSKKMS